MLVLIIVLAVVTLILLTPVGVDAAFLAGEMTLSAKIGPFRLRILPKRSPTAAAEEPGKKSRKAKKEKKRRAKEPGAEKPRQKLAKQDILEIIQLGLRALGRLRRGLCIDRFMLHLTVASDDPYDTVLQYGRFNAALGILLPLVHRAFRVQEEDIGIQMSFTDEKMSFDAAMIATFRIGRILLIVLCAAGGFLAWFFRHRKRTRQTMKEAALAADAEKGC